MRSHLGLGIVLLAVLGCSDDTGLPDPNVPNVERTETLYSLVGTPVGTASAYALEGSRRVRTDASVEFDFAYNIDAEGRHIFLPQAALGIDSSANVKPGFILRTESFEGITTAPSNGYITDDVVPIAVGERYVVRGRITSTCLALGVPKYAKLEVLSFDDAAKTVTFRILTNDNCGFKGLQPGLPDH